MSLDLDFNQNSKLRMGEKTHVFINTCRAQLTVNAAI